MTADNKLERLREIVAELESVAVAFSGGVDSTFLLKVCHDALGDRCLAVTVTSELYPAFEFDDAKRLADEMGVELLTVETSQLDIENFRENPPNRCYYCKKELFGTLLELARERGLKHVVDGANADDTHDFRPGARAASELGVRSPLKEAGLAKDDIRRYSREMGLSTWDKPSFACLASRFPYGTTITADSLDMVAQAEQALRKLGFRQIRVRHHGTVARIELPPEDIARALDLKTRQTILEKVRAAGYRYVTLDLQGYRTGSMNEVL